MDPLTQGLLGVAAAQSLANESDHRKASVLGLLGGMAPDVDVFIRSSSDPLLFLDYHRHFTHSLFFIPMGSFLVAVSLFFFFRKSMRFKAVWCYCLLGYATHAMLDACTSYGTQLLWPFTSQRIAWDNVAVVDFFLTVPLAVFVAIASYKRSRIWARLAVVVVVAYLLLGVVQRERALAIAQDHASARGHVPMRLVVRPSLGNLWLWRSVYETEDDFHVDAVWNFPFMAPVWYEGGSLGKLLPQRDFPHLAGAEVQARDLNRFIHFSDGFIALHPNDPQVVGDIRYSLLPNGRIPLWGIRMVEKPLNEHVEFENFRDVNDQTWAAFFKMIRGQPL